MGDHGDPRETADEVNPQPFRRASRRERPGRSLARSSGVRPGSPRIDAVFGPTQSLYYWSYTTKHNATNGARNVGFNNGDTDSTDKTGGKYVRAVRAGFQRDRLIP